MSSSVHLVKTDGSGTRRLTNLPSDQGEGRGLEVAVRDRHAPCPARTCGLVKPSGSVAELSADQVADVLHLPVRGTGASSSPPGSTCRSRIRPLSTCTCGDRSSPGARSPATPRTAVAVDVAPARAVAGERHLVDLGERGLGRVRPRRDADDLAGIAQIGAPDPAVAPAHRHRVDVDREPLVLRRVERRIGLDIVVALAVAVGVDDEWRPALRFASSPVPRTSCDRASRPRAPPTPLEVRACCWRPRRRSGGGWGSRSRSA